MSISEKIETVDLIDSDRADGRTDRPITLSTSLLCDKCMNIISTRLMLLHAKR